MSALYYEIIEVRDGKVASHVFQNLQEAVTMGRYLAQKSRREVLLRKVTDLAYLASDKGEMIAIDWRCLDAINTTY